MPNEPTTQTVTLDSLTGREAIELEDLTGEPLGVLIDAWENDRMSIKSLLAVVFITRKRTEPGLTYDAVLDEDLDVAMAGLVDLEADGEEAPKE